MKKQVFDCKSEVAMLQARIETQNQAHSEEVTALKEKHKTEIMEMRLSEANEPYDPLTFGLKKWI